MVTDNDLELLLSTTLAGKVRQSVASICLSVCLSAWPSVFTLSLELTNLLT